MTERNTAKLKRADDVKVVRKTAGHPATASEVARLKSELDAAKARIAELERERAEIINRIDWVIDSLHNATD